MHLEEKRLKDLIKFLQNQMESTKPEGHHGGISAWDGKEIEQHREEGRHSAYQNVHSYLSSLLLDEGEEEAYRKMVNFVRKINGLGPRFAEKD